MPAISFSLDFPLLLAAAPLKDSERAYSEFSVCKFSAAFSGGPIEGIQAESCARQTADFPLLLAAAPLKGVDSGRALGKP